MLDDNPVLRERLMAFGAFAGIGIFAIASVHVMISGGFEFGPGRASYDRPQTSAYVRVVDAAQYVSDRFRRISWDEPVFIDTAEAAAPNEDLAGANDGSPIAYEQSDERDLYEEIAALYEPEAGEGDAEEQPTYQQSDEQQAYNAPIYVEQQEVGQSAGDGKTGANAYENASPW